MSLWPSTTTMAVAATLAAGVVAGAAAPALAVARPPRLADLAAAGDVGPVTRWLATRSLATSPLVIGHRGASGYRPEHTLASYELAARMGADFVEPDLVSTKDHVLVARHENEISGTTDVAAHPEFASRRVTKVVEGVAITGWFTEDFTLAELKTLRAKERLPDIRQENTLYDGRFEVPTFAEILALRARLSRELGRPVGVYPETKHPTYFASIGLPLEGRLVAQLRRAGLDSPSAPVFIQSFQLTNLIRMNARGLQARTVFLALPTGAPFDLASTGDPRTYADLLTPDGLKTLRRNGIDGIGPEKTLVVPLAADGAPGDPTALVRDAHQAGLLVHPYTFRAENTFLPPALRVGSDPSAFGRAIDEQIIYWRAGIDGMFADQPDIAILSREAATQPARRAA
jgi:glycerophosphoryl diester phosphodiesterase